MQNFLGKKGTDITDGCKGQLSFKMLFICNQIIPKSL